MEAGGCHADQVGSVVAVADVVRVTHHVVQDHLCDTCPWTLEPEPGKGTSLSVLHVCVCVRVCMFPPKYACNTCLSEQQEVFIWRQHNAVGHVQGIQEDFHESCLRVKGQQASQVVQLDHLQPRNGSFFEPLWYFIYVKCHNNIVTDQ